MYLYDKKTGKQLKRLMPDYVGSIGSISGRKEHERFFLSTCKSHLARIMWSFAFAPLTCTRSL